MRIPWFHRRDRQDDDRPANGQVYLERRPGESNETFEARLAAAARTREGRTVAAVGRPTPVVATAIAAGVADKRPVSPAPRPPRRQRHSYSLVGFAVTLVAVLGALWVVLAVREGSFSAGGAVVDHKLAEVSAPARLAANQAVDRAGQAVQTAGQALEGQGQKLRNSAN